MPSLVRRALPRAAVLLLVALVAALTPLPLPAGGGVTVVVSTDLRTSRLAALPTGTTVVPLPRTARFVALSWAGAHDATVTIATSADGTSYGARRDVGRDGVEIEGDPRTWSGLLFAPGAAAMRVTTDTPLLDVDVTVLADGSPRTAGSTLGDQVAAAAVAQPNVVSRSEWGADETLRDQTYATKSSSFHAVQKLIVHHTGDDPGSVPPSPEEHIRAIYRYHTGSRGFSDIGYNFLVSADGRVFEGRFARVYAPGEEPTGEDTQRRAIAGAHASNYNSGTVGIAVLGNFVSTDPTAGAVAALTDLLSWEADRHGLDPRGATAYDNPSSSTDTPRVFPNIAGHRDVGSTECPGGRLYAMLPSIREAVAAQVAAGSVAPSPSPSSSQPPTPPPGGRFVAVTPARALDTREDGRGPFVGGETRMTALAGMHGVPSTGARAVVLNVTAIEPTRSGFLTLFPGGAARPTASSVNFVAGQTVPNLVTVGLGSAGDIAIYNSAGGTHVAVDLVGWYGESGVSTDNLFAPLPPARLLDTRESSAPLGPSSTRVLTVTGRGGVPAHGVDAVVLNVTAVAPSARGFLTVYPAGTSRPTTSNLNFVPRQTRPNLVVAKLGNGGGVSIFNSSGTTDVVADVVGWFGPPVHTDGRFVPAGRFTAVVPSRAMDTRDTALPLLAGETRRLSLAGAAGVPATGAGAVVLNVTAVSPTASGYLTVYPADGDVPLASNLNFTRGEVVPNAVIVGLSDSSEISILNSSGTTDVVVDVVGWYSRD